MKKILILLLALCVTSTLAGEESEWKDVGNQGKKALKETGHFFKKTTTTIGHAFRDAAKEISSEIDEKNEESIKKRYYGTWVYKGDESRCIIKCNRNGTMEILSFNGEEDLYFEGVYTVKGNKINFNVKRKGVKDGLIKRTEETDEDWKLSFELYNNETKCIFKCKNIPSGPDHESYRNGVVFTK